MAEDWAAEVIEAVDQWAATKRGSGDNRQWRGLGPAREDHDGWLVLDLRHKRVNVDSLNELCLAGDRGPDVEAAYPVDEVRNVDDVLMLRMPPGLPTRCREVWTRSTSPRFLLDKLRDGLRAAGPAPLARALAEGRLSGRPTARSDVAGFTEPQVEALRACLSPGVRLVWGPPGTGKTLVLARAIEELVRRGKRVLLVSTANVAVDNALLAVLPRLPARPGVAIRVGPAHLAEIATDPDVQLELRAAQASEGVDAQRDELAAQLRELDEIDSEIEGLRADIADYDEGAYRSAKARVAAGLELDALRSRIGEAEEAVSRAADRAAAARATEEAAEAAHRDVDAERRALAAYRDAVTRLVNLDREQRAREMERAFLDLQPQPAGRWERWQLSRKRDRADADLRSYVAQAAILRKGLLEVQLESRKIIGSYTQGEVDDADRRLAAARDAAADAHEALELAEQALDALREAATRAGAAGAPTAEDRELIAQCEERDHPGRYRHLQELVDRQSGLAGERGRLEARHRELVDQARRLRSDEAKVVIDAAQVIATTLARSRLHSAIATASFDVVLVDEAGAATLAEVLLALCRATETAVLFGDFLQLGPVLDGLDKNASPAVEKWVGGTCFSHVGIESPSDVASNESCVALTHQFRFGPELRRLANDVIYEVLRDATELPTVVTRPHTEIVLVDVSSVPDLAVVRAGSRSGRWWTAGVVLSRALAELHLTEGPVGVVAPYRVQADVTLASVQDRGLIAGASVGTVHAFQGREYPTVVFDLVDDGQSWVAKGRHTGGSWEYAGLKAFGVGITRARSRLYLIADRNGVSSAVAGPFRELRRAVERGDVQVWSAAAMLGMAEPPPGPVDSTFAEAAELLQELVTVTDIQDEHTFVGELERHLVAAQDSIWMWSPWVANRAQHVIPLLEAAVARGVDVRLFIRPDEDRLMASRAAQRQLPGLVSTGSMVIRSDHEHRKIVVIDERVVLLGSLNALSNKPGSTREIMLTVVGQAFAKRLLTELHVEVIGSPRSCTACGTAMEVRRSGGRAAHLYWKCPRCGGRCRAAVPLA